MRDPLNTKKTRRQIVVDVLTGKHVRTASDIVEATRQISLGSLTAIAVDSFGLLDSAKGINDCNFFHNDTNLYSPRGGTWVAGDVGKTVDIQGAGTAGATLRTTILSVNGGGDGVVVADQCVTSLNGATSNAASGICIWGWPLNLSSKAPPQTSADGTSETRAASLSDDLDAGGNAITDLADPASAQEAATKKAKLKEVRRDWRGSVKSERNNH